MLGMFDQRRRCRFDIADRSRAICETAVGARPGARTDRLPRENLHAGLLRLQ